LDWHLGLTPIHSNLAGCNIVILGGPFECLRAGQPLNYLDSHLGLIPIHSNLAGCNIVILGGLFEYLRAG